MTDTLKQWLRLAEGDYQNALDLLSTSRDTAYPSVCFHSQQCAEKLMKAVLLIHQQEIPRIHDLIRLSMLISPWKILDISPTELQFLSQGAVMARYPGDEPTRDSAKAAIDICEAIRSQLLPLFTLC